MSDEYYSANDLAQKTGVPAPTWRYYAAIGYGPPSIKVGRRLLWRKGPVDEWLDELEKTGQ